MKYDEEKLWIAVIERAIKDAAGKNAELKKEAIEWFDSESFETVCELANLSSKRMKNMYGGFMSKKEIRALLIDNIKGCVSHLIPDGKFYQEKTYVGSLNGDTIMVKIVGKKAGNWRNFTTGTSGDIIDLWTLIKGNIDSAKEWLNTKNTEKLQNKEAKGTIKKGEKAFSVGQYLSDQSPMPKDVIGPKILTPGGLLVIGGTPKVGKSSFLLSLLVHMAAGVPFFKMTPTRPLRILYLQDEMGYDNMRRRVQELKELTSLAKENLVITSEIKITLNDEGVERIKDIIVKNFGTKMIDLIAIDSLTTHLMPLSLLRSGIEKLRSIGIGIIMTHHTKKVSTATLEKNPFQALVGTNALRSLYTSGIVMFQPDRRKNILQVAYELGNGKPIPAKFISRVNGCWKTIATA
ncbi:AAA family ATPase [Wolbachia endosymbiont of Nasonia giraulti]|uniref:AAA family ATPase n=1 Tax=Wolbachia endosymbiont of Nasonia giraulti TaxID=180838 RepID=UPI0012505C5E|nr:AAA family ATPase [Wolbachia endosymbiont of Nasonia oneida]MDU8921122.1 AAA family ATPase [Wolbachia endosymbiont of Scaptomyza pallida]